MKKLVWLERKAPWANTDASTKSIQASQWKKPIVKIRKELGIRITNSYIYSGIMRKTIDKHSYSTKLSKGQKWQKERKKNTKDKSMISGTTVFSRLILSQSDFEGWKIMNVKNNISESINCIFGLNVAIVTLLSGFWCANKKWESNFCSNYQIFSIYSNDPRCSPAVWKWTQE